MPILSHHEVNLLKAGLQNYVKYLHQMRLALVGHVQLMQENIDLITKNLNDLQTLNKDLNYFIAQDGKKKK